MIALHIVPRGAGEFASFVRQTVAVYLSFRHRPLTFSGSRPNRYLFKYPQHLLVYEFRHKEVNRS
jgi:hypothetical protein